MSLAARTEPAADLSVAVTVPNAAVGSRVLAPTGVGMPDSSVTAFEVSGGVIEKVVAEPRFGLGAAVVRATGGPLTVHYSTGDHPADVPADAFVPHESSFTVAAAELTAHAQAVAEAAGGGRAGLQALVDEAAAMFVYGHPDTKFNDGHRSVPLIACGGIAGSCVDINTYLVASLRAAGYEAAYVTGYFFPAEKDGSTTDMHCWVLSRHAGEVLAWDIAHHKKMGVETVRPGLNPKPGERVAISHSMGHSYPAVLSGPPIKLLAEPEWLVDGNLERIFGLDIRLMRG